MSAGTLEALLASLRERYGEDFPWYLLPPGETVLAAQLRREAGKGCPLTGRSLRAAARSAARDDVLFRDAGAGEIYYAVHLTWASHPEAGFPRFRELRGLEVVEAFWEQDFLENL